MNAQKRRGGKTLGGGKNDGGGGVDKRSRYTDSRAL